MVTANDVAQHSPLVLYLLFVIFLSIRLFSRPPYSKTSLLFLICAMIALATTWTYMIRFIMYSYETGRMFAGPEVSYNTTLWLEETSLFDQAWRYVCAIPERWWISSQLCTFTVGLWTIFLFAEASRRPELQGLAWQYMLLGQIVAISFASSLFLVVLSLPIVRSKTRPTFSIAAPTRLLEGCVLAAFVTVLIVPSTTTGRHFLPNLLAMHAIIVLPLAHIAWNTTASEAASHTRHRMRHTRLPSISSAIMEQASFKPLYYATAGASLLLHLKHSFAVYPSVKSVQQIGDLFWETVNRHPAQQSISWDVICTNGIWQLWSLMEVWKFKREGRIIRSQALKAVAVIGLTPSLSAATSIGVFLGMREDWIVGKRRQAKKE